MMGYPIIPTRFTAFIDPNAPAREAQAVTLTKHVKSIPGLANNYASAVARYAAAKNEIARFEQSGAVPERSVRLTITNATSPHYPELLSEIEAMVNKRIGFLRVEALGVLAQRVRDTYAALTATDTQARLAGELPGPDTGPIPPLPEAGPTPATIDTHGIAKALIGEEGTRKDWFGQNREPWAAPVTIEEPARELP